MTKIIKLLAVFTFCYMGVQAMRMLASVFANQMPTENKFIILFMVAVILSLALVLLMVLLDKKSNK
jgi:hypothetical protein